MGAQSHELRLYSGGTDPIEFRFGGRSGTTKAIFNSSGQLLIGDTAVHYSGVDLQVGHTDDAQNGIQIQTSTTGYGYVLFGDGTGGDGSGGLGGTCSLGPQYTTKEACIAAGGTWSESGLLDSDGNYTSAADADGQLYDANGNPLENQDDICKK